ncbi:hypothetical protein B566_EDAN001757 [Ephemera danica]|nr:hypothetical protein B566_EDAN001757 [Ephemera danica]
MVVLRRRWALLSSPRHHMASEENTKYPLYQKGNPQLRVFLPNFFMKLVKDTYRVNQLPNMVTFHVSMEMTEYDVKNYLEKIYNVPVIEVRTEVCEFKKQPWKGYIVKDDDYKSLEEAKKGFRKIEERNKYRPGLPGWFSF